MEESRNKDAPKQFQDDTIREFLQALSSKAPVPGGGGASALAGAFGNALGQMVVNLTVGKKKYLPVEEEMKALLGRMEVLQKEFLCLADEDARVFAPLAKAYGLPNETPEQKAYKDQVMEENLLAASLVPLKIMEKTMEMLDILKILAQKGSRLAVSDVGVGVQFTRAALLGAVMNVYINTKSMKNRDRAEEIDRQAETLIREGSSLADEIYQIVLEAIR
ncbi:MAG: cyclodeaminase/cyclohydrolase family protein [Lachnospiraceae bacterium]